MNKKIIVFDIDGVILESIQAKNKAFKELYKNYGEDIVKKVLNHHKNNTGISRFEKIKFYNKNYLNLYDDKFHNDKFLKNFSELSLKYVFKSNFVKGFLDFINHIYDNHDLYISTGTPTVEAKIILNKKRILNKFIKIFGSPETKISHLKEIISKYPNTDLSNFYFFGDSLVDYEAAQTFNFKFILRCHDENKILQKKDNIYFNFKNYYDSSLLKLFYNN